LSNQFTKLLKRLLLEGLGTHSIRKGGITKGCTGTVDFAPLVAVAQRARWTTQAFDVLLKYAKVEEVVITSKFTLFLTES